MLRVLRSSPGRLQAYPHAHSVTMRWKVIMKSSVSARLASTYSTPEDLSSHLQASVEKVVLSHRWPPSRSFGLALCRTSSGVLTQAKGCLLAFQASRKRWIASLRYATLRKTPRRIALRWTIENQVSTWLSQLALVGVKWSWKRRWPVSHACTSG